MASNEVSTRASTARLIPILPRSGLYLPQYGYGDDRRFARVFRDTWLALPLWARRRMLRHWREDQRRTSGLIATRATRGKPASYINFFECPAGWMWNDEIHTMISPKIELVPYWSGTTVYTDPVPVEIRNPLLPRQPLGQVLWGGHNLRFWSKATDRMPDDIVRRLIAHELAHVYQAAVGDEEWCEFDYAPDSADRECHADGMADYWGFNGDAIDKWIANVKLTKVGVVNTLEEALSRPDGYEN